MKKKKVKTKKPKDWNAILLMSLFICTILCLILGVSLFIVGIRRILPILLIFVLSFILSIAILLLSKDIYLTKRARDKRIEQNRV